MQKLLWILVIFTVSFVLSTAKAADSEMHAQLGSNDQGHAKFLENTQITDTVLRASAGSLSRYSLRFNFSYSGPPVGDLEAREQPNPDGTVAVTATALAGSFGGRYRFSPESSLSLTAGLSDQYIFHDQQRADVNNPYLSYDRAFRLFGLQIVSSPGMGYITATTLRRVSEVASANYSLSTVYDLGESRWAFGAEVTLAYYFFDRAWLRQDGKVRQSNIGFNPSLKYNASDRLNFYTGLGYALWNPREGGDRAHYVAKTTTQKLGAGYAFARDVYFSPYLSFFPGEPRWDSTTINFNTIFSIL